MTERAGEESVEETRERHQRISIERAEELKPDGLPATVSRIWDIMAPGACHPTKNRVTDPLSAQAFAMLCYEIERYHRLDRTLQRHGEVYESETRNGFQLKNRPEVGQRNAAWANAWRAMQDFGMTPATAARVLNELPPDLFKEKDEAAEDFG